MAYASFPSAHANFGVTPPGEVAVPVILVATPRASPSTVATSAVDSGLTLNGQTNLHSHALQRGMAGWRAPQRLVRDYIVLDLYAPGPVHSTEDAILNLQATPFGEFIGRRQARSLPRGQAP